MIENLIKCEQHVQCGKQVPYEPMIHSLERFVPAGWFMLFPAGPDMQTYRGWHFCSRECLAAWSAPTVGDTFNLPTVEDLSPAFIGRPKDEEA